MSPEAIKKQDSGLETALHKAAKFGYWKTAELLLQKMRPEVIQLQNGDGKTAEQLAEDKGHNKVAALFIRYD